MSLKDITVTGRDGRVSQLDQVYIRGSMIRFFIVPDMLQNAPMCVPHPTLRVCNYELTGSPRFKRVGPNAMRGRGIGTARGRATIQRGPILISASGTTSILIVLLFLSIASCSER